MTEPLENLTCQVCKKSFKYGGPDQIGYCREFCGPYCDGFNNGVRKSKELVDKLVSLLEMKSENSRTIR